MLNKSLHRLKKHKLQYFEGLEIGAVSVKWVRRIQNGDTLSEVMRHEGTPREKIKKIFDRYNVDNNSKIVISNKQKSHKYAIF